MWNGARDQITLSELKAEELGNGHYRVTVPSDYMDGDQVFLPLGKIGNRRWVTSLRPLHHSRGG